MTTQIDQAFESWIDAGIIDREWLDNPCPIAHKSPVQPRSARILQWLYIVALCVIGLSTVALIVLVATSRGEL